VFVGGIFDDYFVMFGAYSGRKEVFGSFYGPKGFDKVG
jgi:hypothetical protein